MRLLMVLSVIVTTLSVVACGTPVEVPPAHVGKLSTSSGLQQGIIQPSKLMLGDLCRNCDSLILAEASDGSIKEEMQIFMPQDQLNLKVEVRGTVAISPHEQNIEAVFARVPAAAIEGQSRVRLIRLPVVYSIYAQPIVREVTRGVITKYRIDHIMTNRDAVSQEVWATIREKLAKTPIAFTQFGLADVQPPDIIVKAQEAAKEREVGIARAEADKMVRMKQSEADYEVALKQQQVELKEAETQLLVDQKISNVSPAVIAQRSLRVMSEIAKSGNQVFVLPSEMFRSPAMLVGFSQQVFGDKRNADTGKASDDAATKTAEAKPAPSAGSK